MAVARAAMRSAQRIAMEISGSNYADGGPREARCRAKESCGVALSGSAACRATSRASGMRSSGAAASAGMCSAWQMWQAVSGPPV